ncbi:ATP-dependent DNA helicase [Nephila pilipes]|uniref:ATP-dependent DNA helicase n=1 Tax=Nephila pilipes TaxID=299642 RepID=A0A8X6QYY8_NEPPI|nr:ATP-dependent DNA helicase [Nephila pilipes]
MAPHILMLKFGSPILRLRKWCNETRISVNNLIPNAIEAIIIKGKCKGDVLIPRIPMISTDLPFAFKRLQFPLHLAFSKTINKAQWQLVAVTLPN